MIVLSCSEVETKRLRTCWVPCSSTVLRVHAVVLAVVRRPRPCLSMARLNHRLNGASTSGASPRPLASRPSPHHTHTVPRARPCARVVIGRSL